MTLGDLLRKLATGVGQLSTTQQMVLKMIPASYRSRVIEVKRDAAANRLGIFLGDSLTLEIGLDGIGTYESRHGGKQDALDHGGPDQRGGSPAAGPADLDRAATD